jgi:hypothetical protein
VLDDFYDQVVDECLAEALWNFIVRAVQIDASGTVEPQFGWNYAFAMPDDWVRTVMISTVETFTDPLLDYVEETGYWYADFTPIYARYVSSDVNYGRDLGRWSANFTAYASFKLAEYACGRVTGSTELLQGPDGLLKRGHKAKIKAKSNDAMNQPPGQMPAGTWARSRRGFLRGVPRRAAQARRLDD